MAADNVGLTARHRGAPVQLVDGRLVPSPTDLTKHLAGPHVTTLDQQVASFMDDRWGGQADFLLRTEHPSELGNWSYDIADAKLARSLKARG